MAWEPRTDEAGRRHAEWWLLDFQKVERTRTHLSQIDVAASRGLAAGVVEKLLDDLGNPLGLRRDDVGVFLNRSRIFGATGHDASATPDDVERCADFVRDVGGELSDRRQFVGMTQPLFELQLGIDTGKDFVSRIPQRARHFIEAVGQKPNFVVALAQNCPGVIAWSFIDATNEPQ